MWAGPPRRLGAGLGTTPPGAAGAAPTSAPVEDPIRAYLEEIGRVPLLSAERELCLARQVAEGQAAGLELARLEELYGDGDQPVDLPAARIVELEAAVEAGHRAKAELIEANLRLVVAIAKRYRHRGLPLLDLVQEGNIGLMRAVDKFDYRRGFKFSTYATWWIRQAVTRALADQSRTIRVPVHMVEVLNRVHGIARQLAVELGREPTAAEVAERAAMPVSKVEDVLQLNVDTISLHQPIGEGEDSVLADLLEDQAAEVPPEVATRSFLHRAVKEALAELPEREQEIVRMRFGLDDGEVRTLEEVGRVFGVTRERVRQIEVKTLAKLRHPQRGGHLRGFLEEA
jgi:RNA polymerase primary sigma factor